MDAVFIASQDHRHAAHVEAAASGVYTWKDEHRFTAPDQVQAVWHYPDG